MTLQRHTSLAWLQTIALACACFLFTDPVVADTIAQREVTIGEEQEALDDMVLDLLELEDLMNLEVSTVTRRPDKLIDTPAAVHVITQEDLRAHGITSIPEALRLVPGMNVSRLDGNRWAVSARGLNSRFSKRLLVMRDGRTLYSPLYGGTLWEVQDFFVEDVERLEVVRGPGGTLWGANAVNGIINIITRNAAETQGSLLSAGGGTHERALFGARFGSQLGDKASYRVYGEYSARARLAPGETGEVDDDAMLSSGGFRLDWAPTTADSITVQTEVSKGDFDSISPAAFNRFSSAGLTLLAQPDIENSTESFGYHGLVRWSHTFSERADMAVQAYFDRTLYESDNFVDRRNLFDFDFESRVAIGERNRLVWGAGYRLAWDSTGGFGLIGFDPQERRDHLFSAFIQDEIQLVQDHLWITLGSKFEYNDYTNFEYQPSARLRWSPTENQTLWAAATRSVSTPTRVEDNIITTISLDFDDANPFTGNILTTFATLGVEDRLAERAISYEAGYRIRPVERVAFDVALHYSRVRRLEKSEQISRVQQVCGADICVDTVSERRSKIDARIWGAEFAAEWRVLDNWKITTGYTWLTERTFIDRTSTGADADGIREVEDDAGTSPSHQLHVRSYVRLPWNLDLSTTAYWIGNIRTLQRGFEVPSYVRVDARIGWRPVPGLELSLVGQNLSDSRHYEFADADGVAASQIPRSVYAKITWRR